MGILPQESWSESTDGWREKQLCRGLWGGLRSTDQEVGPERLPERGEACLSLQHEKEGGVWIGCKDRVQLSTAQHSQGEGNSGAVVTEGR